MKRALLPIAILVVAVIISMAMGMLKPEPLKAASPDIALAVSTILAKTIKKQFLVHSQGTVSPRTQTSLISEVSGMVLEVSPDFVVGGVFKRNDIIMSLDSTDYEVDVERANAELASMKAQLVLEEAKAIQAQREWDQTGQSRAKAPSLGLRKPYMDEARAKVQKAEAELKQAKGKLAKTKIRAPYDGMVSIKSVDVGHYVTVGTSLGEVFAIDRAEVRLSITDRDLAILGESFVNSLNAKSQDSTNVTLSASVGGKQQYWDANIVRSEGVVDPLNRNQYLVVHIDDPYGISHPDQHQRLLIGSFVTATIKAEQAVSVIAVPRNAIYEGPRVAIAERGTANKGAADKDKRLRLLAINIYFSDDQYSYIDDGLEEGVELIVSAVGAPVNGMRVNPINKTDPVVDKIQPAIEDSQISTPVNKQATDIMR